MKFLRLILLAGVLLGDLCFIAIWLGPQEHGGPTTVYAQSTSSPYDCAYSYTFTATGRQTGQPNNSLQAPCIAWRVSYFTTGFSTVTVEFDTSADNSTWTAVTNSICSSSTQPPCVIDGANPIAAGVQGTAAYRAYGAYTAINVTSVTGSGSGTVSVFGYKGLSASGSGYAPPGLSGLTTNAVMAAASATTAATPCTNCKLTSSGNLSLNTSMPAGFSGSNSFATGLIYSTTDRLNVKAFGAKGDGSTNDASAINTAITQACSNQAEVYFPAGTYSVGTTGVSIACSNVTLSGVWGQSVIEGSNVSTITINPGAGALQRVLIQGIFVTALGGSTSGDGIEILAPSDGASQISNVSMRNVTAYSMPGNGIHIHNLICGTFEDVTTSTNTLNGIYFDGSSAQPINDTTWINFRALNNTNRNVLITQANHNVWRHSDLEFSGGTSSVELTLGQSNVFDSGDSESNTSSSNGVFYFHCTSGFCYSNVIQDWNISELLTPRSTPLVHFGQNMHQSVITRNNFSGGDATQLNIQIDAPNVSVTLAYNKSYATTLAQHVSDSGTGTQYFGEPSSGSSIGYSAFYGNLLVGGAHIQSGTSGTNTTYYQPGSINTYNSTFTIQNSLTNGSIQITPNGTGSVSTTLGLFGVNNTSPGTMIHAKSATAGKSYIAAEDTSTNNAGFQILRSGTLKWQIFGDGSDNLKFYDGTNNIGLINRGAPASTFVINADGSTTFGGAISTTTATASTGLKTGSIFPSADSTTAVQVNKADNATHVIDIDTTNTRLGVGTTSPGQMIHAASSVNGNSYIAAEDTSTNNVGFKILRSGTLKWQLFGDGSDNFKFFDGTNNIMQVTRAAPANTFVINADGSSTFGGAISTTTATTTTGLKTGSIFPSADSTTAIQVNKADNATHVIDIDTTNTRLGVGTTSPGGMIHAASSVAGNSFIEAEDTSTNNVGFKYVRSGTLKWQEFNDGSDNWKLFDGTNNIVQVTRAAPANTLLINADGSISYLTLNNTGTVPGISGCSAGTQLGGATVGQYSSGTSGTCTVTLTFARTTTNGWYCSATDTSTGTAIFQTGGTHNTAILSGATTSGDVVRFNCVAY